MNRSIDEYCMANNNRATSIVAFSALVLILYVELGIFKQYIFPISILRVVVLVFPVILLMLSHRTNPIVWYDLCWLATIPFLFINNAALEHGYTLNVVCHLAITVFYFACRNDEKWIDVVWRVIKIASVIYAVCTFWFLIDKGFYNNYVFGLFTADDQASLLTNNKLGYAAGLTGHYSHNAMYLTLGVGVFACDILAHGFRRNSRNIFGFILCLLALLSTGKRGPTIFAVCALIILYYFDKSDQPKGRLFKLFFLLIFMLTGLYIIASFFPQVMLVLERIEAAQESGNLTNGRDILTALALELFIEKPIFGIGWYGFRYIHIQEYSWFQYMVHVHNVYIQLLCETGIVGFALYMLFFIGSYIKAIKTYVYERKELVQLPDKARQYLGFSVFIQTYFLLYSFTGNPLYDVMIQFPYMMFCSVPIIYSNIYIAEHKYRGAIKYIRFL